MASLCAPVSVSRAMRQPIPEPNRKRGRIQSKKLSGAFNRIELASQTEDLKKQSGQKSALCWAAVLGIGYGLFSHWGDVAEAISIHKETVGELAMAPDGGKEFWDNMKSYAVFFFTVVTGGFYSIFKPLFDLLTNPFTALFAVVFIVGGLYLLYLTLSAMFGINEYPYPN